MWYRGWREPKNHNSQVWNLHPPKALQCNSIKLSETHSRAIKEDYYDKTNIKYMNPFETPDGIIGKLHINRQFVLTQVVYVKHSEGWLKIQKSA